MACESCIQKILAQNEQSKKAYEEAKELATTTNQWVAIYKDEYGSTKFIIANQAGGYPVIGHVSPKL